MFENLVEPIVCLSILEQPNDSCLVNFLFPFVYILIRDCLVSVVLVDLTLTHFHFLCNFQPIVIILDLLRINFKVLIDFFFVVVEILFVDTLMVSLHFNNFLFFFFYHHFWLLSISLFSLLITSGSTIHISRFSS